MFRRDFLKAAARQELLALRKIGKMEGRVTPRANTLRLLDDGMRCEAVADVLYLDDGTGRNWHWLWERNEKDGLKEFADKGSAGELTAAQQEKLKTWVSAALPPSTAQVGAGIEQDYAIGSTRSAIIKLLHRTGMEFNAPNAVSGKLDVAKQKEFIDAYNALLNALSEAEAHMFADAVHPAHSVRPVRCWAAKDVPVAVDQTSGRDRLNIRGAIALETGNTPMIEVLTVDAASTIALLLAIAIMAPRKRWVHVFLANRKNHHAGLGEEWLARKGMPDQTSRHPGLPPAS